MAEDPKTLVTRTETDALTETLRDLHRPEVMTLLRGDTEAAGVLLLPKGIAAHSVKPFLDVYLPQPERRRGTAKAHDVGAFIELTKRSQGLASAIFSDLSSGRSPMLLAVLNYNEPGADPTTTARWGDHRVQYNAALSPEYLAWSQASGRAQGQTEFAEFLEEHSVSLLDPKQLPAESRLRKLADQLGVTLAEPREVIAASRGLKLRAEISIAEAVTLESGETEVVFSEAHRSADGTRLTIPTAFALALPVLDGPDLYSVLVRLRYRLVPGQKRVTWTLTIHDLDGVLKRAWQALVERARTETGLPVYAGSPE